jgi:hypothetical protein
MAVLMGANTRTYKFALGHALLSLAGEGRESVTLRELAAPYALAMVDHAQAYPQAPQADGLGERDYLRILRDESEATLVSGEPTDRLLDATVRTIPGMVMVKFHNLKGEDGIPHRFYTVEGRADDSRVVFTPALTAVASDGQTSLLRDELTDRWRLVETAFDADIGRSLIRGGVAVSEDGVFVVEQVRRAPVARSRGALIGFQHGRCFYCVAPIDNLGLAHVDHVYPFALMKWRGWSGPDLNAVWNLVVACSECNLRKSDRLPTAAEVQRLIERNDAILGSPHPLRRAIQLTMGDSAGDPHAFYRAVDALARFQ